jgi:serine protease AprX
MKTITYRKFISGFCLILLIGISIPATAQTNYYFYVQLKNKNNSTYSLSNPSAYLSQRSIARRATFNILVDSTDLPVNQTYVQQIENLGVHVHSASKWMNGVTVKLVDSTKMSQVRTLPFVKFVQYTGLLVGTPLAPPAKAKEAFTYGIAAGQINQLNGTGLHNEGFRGKGIHIGVIDAGFTNVDINPCFDSLRLQGRLLGTKDIINPKSNIYSEDTHGAMVLSAMTGNLSGQYLGTAPDASFWLIRTEYSPTEHKVETDFWCSGIEFADSVGVDIATSSLGYYTFDDSSMSFSYADMNGKVSRASRAATLASKKGIVVLVAAGNEGNVTWHYIGSPADADGIISVGAVTSTGTPSYFSSFGPSSDGRIKPEICATGTNSALVSTTGTTTTSNGTSFATPIMAGMMACLLQKYKASNQYLNISALLNSVYKTGSLYANPTAQMGYGIPDFQKAEQNLLLINSLKQTSSGNFNITYNSTLNTIDIRLINNLVPNASFIRIYSITGKLLVNQPINAISTTIPTEKLSKGIYAICVNANGITETKKILIH